jgi:hypothetical protein
MSHKCRRVETINSFIRACVVVLESILIRLSARN